MVVVVLIGVTVTVISLSFSRDVDQVAELEAQRFAALLELVRDESILSGQTYAVEVDEAERSYHFLTAGDKWTPVAKDTVLRPRRLPEYLRIRLDLLERVKGGDNSRVVVQALGDVTPFTLTIVGEHRDYIVTMGPAQNLVIEKREHETS